MLVYFFKLQKLSEPLNDYSQLEEMLTLRALGWSYMALADKYKVEKLTIRYLCRKFGFSEERIKSTIFRQSTRATCTTTTLVESPHTKVNPGKTYAEYLQEDKERKWRRLTEGHINKNAQSSL